MYLFNSPFALHPRRRMIAMHSTTSYVAKPSRFLTNCICQSIYILLNSLTIRRWNTQGTARFDGGSRIAATDMCENRTGVAATGVELLCRCGDVLLRHKDLHSRRWSRIRILMFVAPPALTRGIATSRQHIHVLQTLKCLDAECASACSSVVLELCR